MENSAADDRTVQSPRWRIGLGQLGLVVLALALTMACLRESRGILVETPSTIFSMHGTTGPTGLWPAQFDPYRLFAMGLVAVGVALGLTLAVDALRTGQTVAGRVWRCGIGVVLAAFVLRLSDLLERAVGLRGFTSSGLNSERLEMQVKVVAIALAMALIGALLCLLPPRNGSGRLSRSVMSGGLMSGFSVSVGLILWVAFGGWLMFLVMLAIEAVRNALTVPAGAYQRVHVGLRIERMFAGSPPIAQRIDDVGMFGLLVLLGCIITAAWLGRDLRGGDQRVGFFGNVWRLTSTLLTGLGAVWLVWRGIPYLGPSLAEGFLATLWPTAISSVIGGFALLAIGLTARGAVECGPGEPVAEPVGRVWVWRIAKVLGGFGLVYLLLGAVARRWPERFASDWMLWAVDLFKIWLDPHLWFGTRAPGPLGRFVSLVRLESCLLWSVLLGLLVGLARTQKCRETLSPLDATFGNKSVTLWFLSRVLALLTVMLSLFPAFVLGGLSLIQWFLAMTA